MRTRCHRRIGRRPAPLHCPLLNERLLRVDTSCCLSDRSRHTHTHTAPLHACTNNKHPSFRPSQLADYAHVRPRTRLARRVAFPLSPRSSQPLDLSLLHYQRCHLRPRPPPTHHTPHTVARTPLSTTPLPDPDDQETRCRRRSHWCSLVLPLRERLQARPFRGIPLTFLCTRTHEPISHLPLCALATYFLVCSKRCLCFPCTPYLPNRTFILRHVRGHSHCAFLNSTLKHPPDTRPICASHCANNSHHRHLRTSAPASTARTGHRSAQLLTLPAWKHSPSPSRAHNRRVPRWRPLLLLNSNSNSSSSTAKDSHPSAASPMACLHQRPSRPTSNLLQTRRGTRELGLNRTTASVSHRHHVAFHSYLKLLETNPRFKVT